MEFDDSVKNQQRFSKMSFPKHICKNFTRSCSDVDVIVRFNEKTGKFLCHKKILKEASARFKKELSAKNHIITITKIEPHIVCMMLSYIYEGKLEPASWKTLSEVLIGAISYDITSLSTTCVKLLEDSLDISNACRLLDLASHYSIPSLYSSCLNLCVNAAFYILDSEDFNEVLPSTIMTIVSEPELQVPNEAYVLYCLWIRATIEASRNDVKLTSANIAKYFESYSIYIEHEDIDEKALESYRNEHLIGYFRAVRPRNVRVYPAKRGMKFPLRLPLKSYVQYNAGDIVAMRRMDGQTCIEFSTKASVYVVEFRLACSLVSNLSQNVIDSLWLKSEGNVLFAWDRGNGCDSKVSLKTHKRKVYSIIGKLIFHEFKFSLNDLVKLYRTKTYCLIFKSSTSDLLWPEMNRSALDCPIEFRTDSCMGLTKLILLPCPSIES